MLSKWMRADYLLFYEYAVPTHQIGLIELATKKENVVENGRAKWTNSKYNVMSTFCNDGTGAPS